MLAFTSARAVKVSIYAHESRRGVLPTRRRGVLLPLLHSQLWIVPMLERPAFCSIGIAKEASNYLLPSKTHVRGIMHLVFKCAERRGIIELGKNPVLQASYAGSTPAPGTNIPYPGIAQLAEHAIDNREIVGSTPTPWTTFERASPSGKAPGFQPGSAWVRFPPPAPSLLSCCTIQT